MVAVVRVLGLLVLMLGIAHAAPRKVAMLPLDTSKHDDQSGRAAARGPAVNLDLYGQPVARELSKALIAGDMVVVVVGAKATVPPDARLIVDGTITQGAGTSIELALRIRNPLDGKVLDTLSATAPDLANLDRAAADLAARLVPVVRAHFARLDAGPAAPTPAVAVGPAHDASAPRQPRPAARSVGLVVAGNPVLRSALEAAALAWGQAGRELAAVPGARDVVMRLDVAAYVTVPGATPMTRARVRARITRGTQVLFDRVVTTDTIVGDPGMATPALAARAATEVLAILQPHVRRVVPGWQ